MYSTRDSSPILITLVHYQHILAKPSNTKFYENPSSGNRVDPCGRTDRETDVTKLYPIVAIRKICERAYKLCLNDALRPVYINVHNTVNQSSESSSMIIER
jgi:hypothetical protein